LLAGESGHANEEETSQTSIKLVLWHRRLWGFQGSSVQVKRTGQSLMEEKRWDASVEDEWRGKNSRQLAGITLG
jgi:hypothetical protein